MAKKLYETPVVEVVEVYSEGVFCVSGQKPGLESWEEKEFEW